MRDPNDTALLARLQTGDELALGELADAYSSKIYQLAFRYLRNKEDAEEVTQDVLYKVYRKVGAFRGDDASWNPALAPADLAKAVHDNLGHLGLDALDVVNLRVGGIQGPFAASIEPQFTALAELQRQGLIRHLGLSNVTPDQIDEGRAIAEVVCVQNYYNLAHRADDPLIDDLARKGIAYAPFFPLGGFSPLQSSTLSDVATRLGASPMQVALAWLLRRSPNILLIPGTASLAHLRENLAAVEIVLSDEAVAELDAVTRDDAG